MPEREPSKAARDFLAEMNKGRPVICASEGDTFVSLDTALLALDAFAQQACDEALDAIARVTLEIYRSHLAARDKGLSEDNHWGALTQARQAQTADAIYKKICALKSKPADKETTT